MSDSSHTVTRLPSRLVGPGCRLLARAFAADPVIGHYLAGWRHEVVYPGFFRAVVEEAVPAGHVYAALRDGALDGVAVWVVPPGVAAASGRTRLRMALALAPTRALFPWRSRTLLAGFDRLAEHHPTEPNWYLAFVGVEPDRQGRGVGAALLEPVLRTADATATACYLDLLGAEPPNFVTSSHAAGPSLASLM